MRTITITLTEEDSVVRVYIKVDSPFSLEATPFEQIYSNVIRAIRSEMLSFSQQGTQAFSNVLPYGPGM